MRKHLKTLFAALLVLGALASCTQDMDELKIENTIAGPDKTGGGDGGGGIEPDEE